MSAGSDQGPGPLDRVRRALRPVRRIAYVVLFVVLSPVLAGCLLLVALFSLPESVAADRNEGLPGTYTVTRFQEGHGRGSSDTREGTFVSDDRTVRLEDVTIEGDDAPNRVGAGVRAQYVEDSWSSGVYTRDPGAAVTDVLLAGVPFGWLAYWAWRVLVRPRER